MTPPGDRRLRLDLQPLPDLVLHSHQVGLLRLSGEIDASTSAELVTRLRASVDERPKDLVMDLSTVTFLSMAGAEALVAFGERFAADGRRLLVSVGPGQVRRLLGTVRAADVLDLHPTVDAAVAAYLGRPGGVREEDPDRLREQVRRLRADLRTRPIVARAMGILQGRYRLSGGEAAFALLRDGSQKYNLKLRSLAAALLTAPPPASPAAEWWFPERVRTSPPAMSFSARARHGHDNRSTVLEIVLRAALSCMRTSHGSVQLIDPVEGGLRLELQQGFAADFTDVFAYVEGAESACAVALRRGERVLVSDLATGPIRTGPAGEVLRQAGCRSLQSTPLTGPDGKVLGVLSTYDSRPGRRPTAAEEARLDLIAREAGAWLDWHENTIVRDALEFLHQRARRPPHG